MDGLPSDYLIVDNKDIIHVVSGTFPIRRDPDSGHKIRDPLNDEEFNWSGYVPYKEKPRGSDPKEGFYVAGSTTPLFEETIQVTRMKQILTEKIASGNKLSEQDAIDILKDDVDLIAKQIANEIVSILPQDTPL